MTKCCNNCGDELVCTAAGPCLVLVCVWCEMFYITGTTTPLVHALPEIPSIVELAHSCITFGKPLEPA